MSTGVGVDFDAIAEAISPDQLAGAIGAEKVRGGYRCPSPDHDDSDPSFSIFRDGSRTAAKCHGCDLRGSPVTVASRVWGIDAPAAAERLAREIGLATGVEMDPDRALHLRGLRPETVKSFGIEPARSRRAWRYPVDVPGFYRLKSWNGKPRYMWEPGKPPSGGDVYGLPVQGNDALLVEGEPDVWTCVQAGLPAISFMDGATNVPEAGVRAIVEVGIKRVAIIYDRDEAGQKGSIKAARALRDAGLAVEVRRLPSNMPRGSDLTDLYNVLERDDEAFRRAVKELEVVEGDEDALPALIRALDAPEPEPVEWEVYGQIPKGQIGAIVGQGGVGKDTLALALALARAGGYAPLDNAALRTGGPSAVAFFTEEDTRDTVLGRGEALIRGHGWDRETVLGNFHFLTLGGVSLDSEQWTEHIISEVKRVGATLVFLGPLRELTTAEENSNSEMAEVIRRLRAIASRTGAAVGIIHHAGKAAEGRSKLDRMRGASALNQAARWILWLEPQDPGFLVDCIKLTVAEPPEPFVVEREIQTSMDNPGVWHKATLRYRSTESAERTHAEEIVLTYVRDNPGENSTAVRDAGKEAGGRPNAISKAIRDLESKGLIRHEGGPRGSKLWYPATLRSETRRVGGSDPAYPASDPAYAGTTEGVSHPASPSIEGRGVSTPSGDTPTQGERSDGKFCPCGAPIGPAVEECARCRYGGDS